MFANVPPKSKELTVLKVSDNNNLMNISQNVGDQMKTNWHPIHIGLFPLQAEPTSKQQLPFRPWRQKFKSLFGWLSTSVVQLFEFLKNRQFGLF
jgi:hypothetical protein